MSSKPLVQTVPDSTKCEVLGDNIQGVNQEFQHSCNFCMKYFVSLFTEIDKIIDKIANKIDNK
jgi:hypothetical protein